MEPLAASSTEQKGKTTDEDGFYRFWFTHRKALYEIYIGEHDDVCLTGTFPISETFPEGHTVDAELGKIQFPGHFRYLVYRFFVYRDMLYLDYTDVRKSSTFIACLHPNPPTTYRGSYITLSLYDVMRLEAAAEAKETEDRHELEKARQDEITKLDKTVRVNAERHRMEIIRLTKQLEDTKMELKQKKEYIDALPRNWLTAVRGEITDFKIVCNDEVVIPVHRAILTSFWPFFKTMMETNSKEKEDSSLHLDYSSDVVELLVADIYGQKIDFDYDQALSLLELTGLYDLPNLSAVAYEKILLSEPDLDLEDCVNGWRSARLGNHATGKTFFSKLVKAKTPPALAENEERPEFDGMTQQETLELLFDLMRI